MSQLAIIYHRAHGHTEHIARQVHLGMLDVDAVDARLHRVVAALGRQAVHPAADVRLQHAALETACMCGRHFAPSLNRVMVPA